jgi:outer membrane protein assembly factor BamA
VQQDFIHVGPGTNDAVTPTNVKFGPAEAPGIAAVTSYFIAGCALSVDYRDKPEFPHKGTAAFVGFHGYDAETFSRYSFTRLSASAKQYIPFFNEKRVIALLGATELSFRPDDRLVPFYMQPTLGNYDNLRGFRPLRFYDENSAFLNAEYRWEICTGIDMAVFGDTGEVFHRPDQFSFSNLQTSAGFGFRFNDLQSTFMRIDVGFSREGFQVWFLINKLF